MQRADGSTKGTAAFDLLASYRDGDRPRSRSEESASATPTRRAQSSGVENQTSHKTKTR